MKIVSIFGCHAALNKGVLLACNSFVGTPDQTPCQMGQQLLQRYQKTATSKTLSLSLIHCSSNKARKNVTSATASR